MRVLYVAVALMMIVLPAKAGCVTIPKDGFVILANDNTDTGAVAAPTMQGGQIRLDCKLPLADWGKLSFSSNRLCNGNAVAAPANKCKILTVTATTANPDKYAKLYLRNSLMPGK